MCRLPLWNKKCRPKGLNLGAPCTVLVMGIAHQCTTDKSPVKMTDPAGWREWPEQKGCCLACHLAIQCTPYSLLMTVAEPLRKKWEGHCSHNEHNEFPQQIPAVRLGFEKLPVPTTPHVTPCHYFGQQLLLCIALLVLMHCITTICPRPLGAPS